MRWWLIDLVDGQWVERAAEDLPPRPDDAHPAAGDESRPWYAAAEHAHLPTSDGCLGGHVFAESFGEAVRRTIEVLRPYLGEIP